jgi:GTP:adenosylcobinamide-phosphate guanylyltransferase
MPRPYHNLTIIVQSGGRGSRLEALTRNKPKCLVSIDNLPIIFHLFNTFPKANFKIIADYKSEVLEKYLEVFAKHINHKVIKTDKKGTCSGIINAIEDIPNKQSVILTWCDLILPKNINLPLDNQNYIGISRNFECRMSYKDGCFFNEKSSENGVAGFFIFNDKKYLENTPHDGEFVPWLAGQNIELQRFHMEGTKEIGTMISFYEHSLNKVKYRPFNKIEFHSDHVIKYPITEEGIAISEKEINWYDVIQKQGYAHIPQIQNLKPLTIERIDGKSIFEYQNLTPNEQQNLLGKIINIIDELHHLKDKIKASVSDCMETYATKTFDRLEKVKSIIPFANDEYITINTKKYKNIFFFMDAVVNLIKENIPEFFYVIHGDPTFSNIMLKTDGVLPVLIDPRGYFGKTKIYGDRDYDFAKLYYSIIGNYDQFNNKNFILDIKDNQVFIEIKSNGWEACQEWFFEETQCNMKKIKLLHSLIWLSLTTYAWDDYDSICGAFYNGLIYLDEVI